MHGVVGAALLAVVDDVDAGGLLPGDHVGDGVATAASSAAGAAPLAPPAAAPPPWRARQAAGVGGENAFGAAAHCMTLPMNRRRIKQEQRRAARQAAHAGAELPPLTATSCRGTDKTSIRLGRRSMSTGTRRDSGSTRISPSEDVAGNGLLHRRALLGARHRLRRRDGHRRVADRRRRRAARRTIRGAWRLGAADAARCRRRRGSRRTSCARSSNPQERAAHLARAHAAPSAQRHGHAERPAFLHQPFRHAGHRSRRSTSSSSTAW